MNWKIDQYKISKLNHSWILKRKEVCKEHMGQGKITCAVLSQSCPAFVTPWAIHMGLFCPWGSSRQEYLSGFLCPLPGHLPKSDINPGLLHCRQTL